MIVSGKLKTNFRGYRVGESHPNAKLSDKEVARIRVLHEKLRFGYLKISRLLKIPLGSVKAICRYESRGEEASGTKAVKIDIESEFDE
jgi:hypothetical protein